MYDSFVWLPKSSFDQMNLGNRSVAEPGGPMGEGVTRATKKAKESLLAEASADAARKFEEERLVAVEAVADASRKAEEERLGTEAAAEAVRRAARIRAEGRRDDVQETVVWETV